MNVRTAAYCKPGALWRLCRMPEFLCVFLHNVMKKSAKGNEDYETVCPPACEASVRMS